MTAFQDLAARLKKPMSRLQMKMQAKPLTVVTERDFKHEVWTRDKHRCRCCGRKVLKTISRVPERGEVHHIHGRIGDLRFEAKAALLLCLACHERVTGRVNDRVALLASKTFTTRQGTFTDARAKVTFQKVA